MLVLRFEGVPADVGSKIVAEISVELAIDAVVAVVRLGALMFVCCNVIP
jgi:hypothetical protein